MTKNIVLVATMIVFLFACSGGNGVSPDAESDTPDADDPPADSDVATDADAESEDAEPDSQDSDRDGEPGDADFEGDAESDAESGSDADSESDVEPPLFDMEMIGDTTDIECELTNHRTAWSDGTRLDVWSVSFNSFEVVDGELQTIRMRGFASKPTGDTDIPGVVLAHGLGGYSEDDHAMSLAANLDMYVLAYTGPGGGTDATNTSEGLSATHDEGRRLFDTIPDRRGSWFWGHAVAAMRAVTCLETIDHVDSSRLGITGFSAGGVVSLITAGVDDRISAAVPLSGTLRWEVATESATAWQHELLALAGYDTDSEHWINLIEWLDAAELLGETEAAILMANGTTDEFFPLTAHMATFDDIAAGDHRLSFAANFDHGCFSLTGIEDADDIEERAEMRANGGQRAWFRHHFGTDDDYDCMPAMPTLTATPVGALTAIAVEVDESCSNLEVEQVELWASNDGAVLFFSTEVNRQGPGLWGDLIALTWADTFVAYADVQYRTSGIIFRERFSLSTRPTIPEGFVPRIRSMTTCLPPP